MAGITCSNGSSDSAHPKWKQISGTIKGGLVLPDKVIRTASDGRNGERLLSTEIPIPKRSLVTSTYINSSNKRNISMKTVSTPSKRICSNSTAGGTYCIARWCGNSAKKTPGISLFRIPKDPDRWVSFPVKHCATQAPLCEMLLKVTVSKQYVWYQNKLDAGNSNLKCFFTWWVLGKILYNLNLWNVHFLN